MSTLRRTRVTRREAARILQTSYDNVRRLQRTKQLATGTPDREGTVTYDRREVEALAAKRGLQVRPSGELAARVFSMFKAGHRFEDIIIETQQEPGRILELWRTFRAGFRLGDLEEQQSRDERAQQEHDEQMRAMDGELERRRREMLG